MAKETDPARVLNEIRNTPALDRADLLLLQEVKGTIASQMAAVLGLHVAQPACAHGSETELAILSRDPLSSVTVLELPQYGLGFHSRHRFALSGTVTTASGPVRVFNAHLDTRINGADRLAQLAPVLDAAASTNGPVLIGGDFNSNGFYWLGHVLPVPAMHSQADRISQAMSARGFRSTLPISTSTFDYLGMHLDWIWARGVQVGTTAVYPMHFSDHHALATRVGLPD
jgi:endonuclease/exonuclease/phosphatase (EEP) superfamily protein YafD